MMLWFALTSPTKSCCREMVPAAISDELGTGLGPCSCQPPLSTAPECLRLKLVAGLWPRSASTRVAASCWRTWPCVRGENSSGGSRQPALRGGFQNPVARQPLGIRRPWRSFSVLRAQGGEHGVEGGGVGGGDHRPDRGPAVRDRAATLTDYRGRRDAALLRPRGRAVAGAAGCGRARVRLHPAPPPGRLERYGLAAPGPCRPDPDGALGA